jgi:high-affinity K+ transport system ATPase subunit B
VLVGLAYPLVITGISQLAIGVGGLIAPFIGIKLVDIVITALGVS